MEGIDAHLMGVGWFSRDWTGNQECVIVKQSYLCAWSLLPLVASLSIFLPRHEAASSPSPEAYTVGLPDLGFPACNTEVKKKFFIQYPASGIQLSKAK